MWQCAGIVGIDPGPLTLRELIWMAEASPTWTLMAVIANCHRDPKKRPLQPGDFMPFRRRHSQHRPLADLKGLFTGGKLPVAASSFY